MAIERIPHGVPSYSFVSHRFVFVRLCWLAMSLCEPSVEFCVRQYIFHSPVTQLSATSVFINSADFKHLDGLEHIRFFAQGY